MLEANVYSLPGYRELKQNNGVSSSAELRYLNFYLEYVKYGLGGFFINIYIYLYLYFIFINISVFNIKICEYQITNWQ